MPVTQPQLSLDTIGYVIFFTKDVAKCLAFYRDVLGMKVKLDGGEHWSELETANGLTLALHGLEPGKTGPTPGGAEVVFSVPDPIAAGEQLKALGVLTEKPKVVFEAGPKVGVSVIFRDPGGNLLSVFGIVPKGRVPA